MLADVPSYANSEAPWFSARVMSAIAAKRIRDVAALEQFSAIFPRLCGAPHLGNFSCPPDHPAHFFFQRPVMAPAKEPAAAHRARLRFFETTQIPSERDDILLRPGREETMSDTSATRKAAFWVGIVFLLGAALGGVLGYVFCASQLRGAGAPDRGTKNQSKSTKTHK